MRKRILWMLPVAAAAAVGAGVGLAGPGDGSQSLSNVPTPNTKAAGYAPWNKTSAEIVDVGRAQGSTPLENPVGITRFYGYQNDVVSPDDPNLPQMVPTNGLLTGGLCKPAVSPAAQTCALEAQKTEPDKNTYLVFKNGLPGADAGYDYGRSFLFQGHEIAARDAQGRPLGYVTRINLDADAAHRVTLVATQEHDGTPMPVIDGSTWDPFAKRLLFTSEGNGSTTGGVWQVTADSVAPTSNAQNLLAQVGRGGFEGIQNDSAGDLYIVEDIGGDNKVDPASTTTPPATTPARRPNSYVYRFVPDDPADLTTGGKLQALQVLRSDGTPITFASQLPLNSPDQLLIHSGATLDTKWITVHTGITPGGFNANLAARNAGATPFKRPENGVFRPGTHFGEFYFDETGDTNATSPENGAAAGWGSIVRLSQLSPKSDTGKLTLFYLAKRETAGFDNIQFLTRDGLAVVQDMGDTLHTQTKTLDSGFLLDVTADYSSTTPLRWLAEGRDPSATLDSANGFAATPTSTSSKNDGDNEITGIHVSDGDPSINGILGAKMPTPFRAGWRWFWTQQHGDNATWEVLPANAGLSRDESENR
ncbi:MAG TPA: alkaline phosphatase PhoX [Gaiellaceae bacterium]|nr:alkaline phosphatase PhoX [Gaiellaceae bacterium]